MHNYTDFPTDAGRTDGRMFSLSDFIFCPMLMRCIGQTKRRKKEDFFYDAAALTGRIMDLASPFVCPCVCLSRMGSQVPSRIHRRI